MFTTFIMFMISGSEKIVGPTVATQLDSILD